MMVSTVDFDFKTFKNPDLAFLFFAVRLNYVAKAKSVKRVEVYQTSRGFHAYVLLDGEYEFWKSFVLRAFLKDDWMRLEFDMFRKEGGEILFQTKYICRRVGKAKNKRFCRKASFEMPTSDVDKLMFKEFVWCD